MQANRNRQNDEIVVNQFLSARVKMLQQSFLPSSQDESQVQEMTKDHTRLYVHYTEQKPAEAQKIFYFLFVNPKSGNKQGKQYLTIGKRTVEFKFGRENQISIVKVFNLFDPDINQAFEKVKETTEKFKNGHEKIRMIICGGDGTINWVLTHALKVGVDLDKIAISILPIGTGNDFSRSTGWGYKTITFGRKNLQSLRRIVKLWNEADEDYYDLWDIEIKTQKTGHFFDIKNQQQRKIEKNVLRRSFTNYVGVGLDARIVYQVERNRGRNAFFNKILYSIIGTLNYCRHLRPIDEYVYSFRQITERDSKYFSEEDQQNMDKSIQESFQTMQASKINDTVPEIEEFDLRSSISTPFQDQFKFDKGHRGLVCLNCTSYMSGIRNIWSTQKSVSKEIDLEYSPQKSNDGLIEFMTFENQLSLALERISRNGNKLAQGKGPFLIQFKKVTEGEQETFMQIDGESLKVINIESIKIERSKRFKNGKIKILKRKNAT